MSGQEIIYTDKAAFRKFIPPISVTTSSQPTYQTTKPSNSPMPSNAPQFPLPTATMQYKVPY